MLQGFNMSIKTSNRALIQAKNGQLSICQIALKSKGRLRLVKLVLAPSFQEFVYSRCW